MAEEEEKLKIHIPVLKVKGLRDSERMVIFTAWQIKLETVLRFYNVDNMIMLDNPFPDPPVFAEPPNTLNAFNALVHGLPEFQGMNAIEIQGIYEQRLAAWTDYHTKIRVLTKKRTKAYTILLQAMDEELVVKYIYGHPEMNDRPKALLDEMKRDFHPQDDITVHFSKTEFNNLKIEKNENVEDFSLLVVESFNLRSFSIIAEYYAKCPRCN
jgi:hypothetical protein